MNWKSTTLVSGAGLLATWFAAVPPSSVPADGPADDPLPAPVAAAAASIEHEASRLQGQLRPQADFVPPIRDPFRFSRRQPPSGIAREPDVAAESGPVRAPAPVMMLVGIAADETADGIERTAILSTSAGVLLVRVGDDVLGRYRVTAIAGDALELVSLADGEPLRLAFRP
jgi:hypothetical protein